MKKLIGLCVLLTLLASSALSQVVYQSYSFIAPDVKSIVLTNLVGLTNFLASDAQGTNVSKVRWTNQAGGLFIAATNSAKASSWTNVSKNLFQDVPLWALRDGAISTFPTNTAVVNVDPTTFINVLLVTTNNSGAGGACTYVFAPLYKVRNTIFEGPGHWSLAIAATASSVVTTVTNVPIWKWPGAYGMRLMRVTNADTDAAGDVAILELGIGGFAPK